MKFDLSPLFLSITAFCFSMTIGVLWEFFEFAMDQFFALDMQKDTIVHAIHSVTLDPTNTNTTITIDGITDTQVNGVDLGVGGYLDIGLIDTMEDLIVNFIGATVFLGHRFFYVRSRGKNTVLGRSSPGAGTDAPSRTGTILRSSWMVRINQSNLPRSRTYNPSMRYGRAEQAFCRCRTA